jgi:uncharacterized protein
MQIKALNIRTYRLALGVVIMESFLAHCAATFSAHGGMFAIFFLGGLTGSLTHCLVMCGPVVACQSACGGACGTRMRRAAQWEYHLGRFVTYGALGFVAALLSRQLMALPHWATVARLMVLVAGALFFLSAISPNRHSLFKVTPNNSFLRGVLMSFMPCGLIYAALMMAATLANPLAGMLAMWLFVLGTLPALLLASGTATMLAARWQHGMHGIGRVGMAFNGLTLLVLASKGLR